MTRLPNKKSCAASAFNTCLFLHCKAIQTQAANKSFETRDIEKASLPSMPKPNHNHYLCHLQTTLPWGLQPSCNLHRMHKSRWSINTSNPVYCVDLQIRAEPFTNTWDTMCIPVSPLPNASISLKIMVDTKCCVPSCVGDQSQQPISKTRHMTRAQVTSKELWELICQELSSCCIWHAMSDTSSHSRSQSCHVVRCQMSPKDGRTRRRSSWDRGEQIACCRLVH